MSNKKLDNIILFLQILSNFEGSCIDKKTKNDTIKYLQDLIKYVEELPLFDNGCLKCALFRSCEQEGCIGKCLLYNKMIPRNEKRFDLNGCERFIKKD